MARTVQEIFDEAIHLIDAQRETSGETDTSDTLEYKVRACRLLSTLLNEAYPYSDTYAAEPYDAKKAYAAGTCVTADGVRYLCTADAAAGTSVTDPAFFSAVGRANGRPTLPPVTEMTDLVYMDDFICLSALPAGLAALFVYDEDTTKYNAFWGNYMNRLSQARATAPASDGFEDVENPYSFSGVGAGIEYGEFSRWNY